MNSNHIFVASNVNPFERNYTLISRGATADQGCPGQGPSHRPTTRATTVLIFQPKNQSSKAHQLGKATVSRGAPSRWHRESREGDPIATTVHWRHFMLHAYHRWCPPSHLPSRRFCSSRPGLVCCCTGQEEVGCHVPVSLCRHLAGGRVANTRPTNPAVGAGREQTRASPQEVHM